MYFRFKSKESLDMYAQKHWLNESIRRGVKDWNSLIQVNEFDDDGEITTAEIEGKVYKGEVCNPLFSAEEINDFLDEIYITNIDKQPKTPLAVQLAYARAEVARLEVLVAAGIE